MFVSSFPVNNRRIMSDEKKQDLTKDEEQKSAESASAEEVSTGSAAAEESDAAEPEEPSEPSLEERLEAARGESQANYDRYVRAVAEMENYRRRALRDKEEARKYAVSSLTESLLPVLDNLGHGLKAAAEHSEAQGFVQGFEMVYQQLKSILREHGVEEIHPEGEAFDPHRHESTGYVPHEEIPEGNVVHVTRRGYALNDRLLRPAMVLLSSGPSRAETSSGENGRGEDGETSSSEK